MRTLFIILLFSSEVFSQQTTEWLNMLENPKYPKFEELKPENLLTKYSKYDFSDLLIPKTEILGCIGEEYRRIKVDFESINKSENTANIYLVKGKTTVSNNTCDFEGEIIIEQVREFKNMHYGVDEMYKDSGFISQGVVIGRYLLGENPEQNHVGTFSGVMTMYWYVDQSDKIQYDDLNTHSDTYKNNQYVGMWNEYGKANGKTCNWGEYRIPFSGDLDIGAGEFSVNPKYKSNGWDDYEYNPIYLKNRSGITGYLMIYSHMVN